MGYSKSGFCGHTPRKRFGQNFLHDVHIIDRIIRAINPKPGEQFVEIGPGLGALTVPLLQIIGELTVIELDRNLIPALETISKNVGNLNIYSADALTFNFSLLNPEPHSLRIVGNLPYNISTPLLFHLIAQASIVHDMHFMLQKEVVERIVAKPDTPAYGRLSVMLQYFCEVTSLFVVKPGAFHPVPKVDSAIVKLTPYQTFPHATTDVVLLQKVVAQAFNQRRKTLRNSLKGLITPSDLQQIGIDPQSRPENLSLHDYIAISEFLSSRKFVE